MPTGKYLRTPKILDNIRRGRKAMWARRSKEQRSEMMSKLARIQQSKLTSAERRDRIIKMNKARKLKYEKQS